ncbi:cytochrome P450 [Nocardia ninae]
MSVANHAACDPSRVRPSKRRNATLGGAEIPTGELVLVALASANRDERHFADPAAFAPDRPSNHIAFGHGIHYCLGGPGQDGGPHRADPARPALP